MVTTPVFEHLFNIGQGLKSFDTSGNHRHSVLSGNPVWVNGRKGKAIRLDGVDDAFVAPVTENVNEDFTVAFWVQNWVPGSGGAGLGILALQTASDIHATNNSLIIYKDISTGEIKVACYDTDAILEGTLESGSTASSGFMCVRKTGLTVSFFLNGAFVDEITITELNNFDWVLVGLTAYNYTKADWIDKIRYWDSALSDEEIEYWYAKDKPRWNDSCVLWLRGDEENGVAVKDYSPQANDGTLTATLNDGVITGASWVVDEEKGKCLSFDGVNDKVLIPYDASTSPVDDSFSWCFWVKNAFGDNTYPFSTMGTNGYYIRVTDKGILVFVQYSGITAKAISGTSVPLDEWAHCVVVRDVDTGLCRMYVNGVKIHEESHGGFTLDRVLSVYVQNVGFYAWYGKGLLRDLRMYRKALTNDEVSALYNRTSEVSYGCVGKWLLNEGSGVTAYDSHNRFPLKRGNGINFNGVAESVFVADNDSLDITESITCIATIKTTKTSKQAVIAKATAYLFYVGTSITGRVYAYIYGDSTWRYGNTNVCDGEKHFIAVTYQPKLASDNMVFYVDGEQDGVTTGSGGINTSSAGVGVGYRNTIDYYDYFQGLIDEAMVFNRALSATEIKRVYEADGFLDYIPLRIQDGSLTVSVDSVGVQWDSWANGACRRKHLGLGKNVSYTFTVLEEVSDVPWLDSAAYILKEKKDSGTPVDLYIKKTDVLAAESTSVVIDSMNVRYSPTMQVRYIDFSVREQ